MMIGEDFVSMLELSKMINLKNYKSSQILQAKIAVFWYSFYQTHDHLDREAQILYVNSLTNLIDGDPSIVVITAVLCYSWPFFFLIYKIFKICYFRYLRIISFILYL